LIVFSSERAYRLDARSAASVRAVSGILALLLSAEPEDPGHFVPFSPLPADELFAKRMRFDNGEPIISVGIMDAQAKVQLAADGPTRLMFDEASLPKTVYAPPDSRFTMRPLSAQRAVLRFWAVVATKKYGEAEAAEDVRREWAERGYPTKVFETGTIVGLRGNVLDTRERQIAVGDFASEAQAEALIGKLSQKESVRPFVHEELVRSPRGVIGIYDERGHLIHRASDSVYFGTIQSGRIEIEDVEHSRGYASHGRQTRSFWGHVYVVIDRSGKLAVTNSVGAEVLLKGLVPAEIFATAPLEALKAQAVTARGEIFSKLGHRHYGDPFHLCSEMHCQVYAGAGFERDTSNRAVEETRGLLAVRPRKKEDEPLSLVDSVYSSTCGGFSEDNEVVWDNSPADSLRARLDGIASDPALAMFSDGLTEENVRSWLESYPPSECARSSFVRKDKFRWTKKFAGPSLVRIVDRLGLGALKDVQVLGRGRGGRVKGLRLIGTIKTVDVVRELPVRRLFENLSSGMFVLDLERSANGLVKAVTFTGGGWGHGVGMCQVGAIGRAERGQDFRAILAHYYNGATVVGIY
jgi:stage II sporulation protein D